MSGDQIDPPRWDWASLVWLVWSLAGLAFEITMLATHQARRTLSAQVWHVEGTGWTFARYLVATLLTWLNIHMVFKVLR